MRRRQGSVPVVALDARTDPRGLDALFMFALIATTTIDRALPLGGIGQIVPGARIVSGVPVEQRALAGLIAATTAASLLLVARHLWLRAAWARRRPWVLVGTVTLAARVGVSVADRAPTGLVGERPSGSTLDELVVLAALALLLHRLSTIVATHRDRLASLRTVEAELEVAVERGEEALDIERARLVAQVRTLLEARLDRRIDGERQALGSGLRALAEDVLRPLSHRLAELDGTPVHARAVRRAPLTLRLRETVRGLAVVPVVRPRLLTTVMVLLTFRLSLTTAPADQPGSSGTGGAASTAPVTVSVDWASLVGSLAQHLVVLVAVLAGTRIIARSVAGAVARHATLAAWMGTGVGTAGIATVVLGTLQALQLVPDFTPLRPASPALLLGFMLPLVLLILGSSLAAAIEARLGDDEQRLAAANRQLAGHVARLDALLIHERRRFARRLHSSVQAAVNAAALLLERSATEPSDGGHGGTPDVVGRAHGLIGDAIAGLDADDTITMSQRLADIRTAWEDLCAVSVEQEPAALAQLDDDPPAREAVADLVAEACSNSVVHGEARTVTVAVATHPDGVAIRVEDDGRRRGTEPRRGLGTRFLAATCTEWSLEHHEHGTTLRATLPVRAASKER